MPEELRRGIYPAGGGALRDTPADLPYAPAGALQCSSPAHSNVVLAAGRGSIQDGRSRGFDAGRPSPVIRVNIPVGDRRTESFDIDSTALSDPQVIATARKAREDDRLDYSAQDVWAAILPTLLRTGKARHASVVPLSRDLFDADESKGAKSIKPVLKTGAAVTPVRSLVPTASQEVPMARSTDWASALPKRSLSSLPESSVPPAASAGSPTPRQEELRRMAAELPEGPVAEPARFSEPAPSIGNGLGRTGDSALLETLVGLLAEQSKRAHASVAPQPAPVHVPAPPSKPKIQVYVRTDMGECRTYFHDVAVGEKCIALIFNTNDQDTTQWCPALPNGKNSMRFEIHFSTATGPVRYNVIYVGQRYSVDGRDHVVLGICRDELSHEVEE